MDQQTPPVSIAKITTASHNEIQTHHLSRCMVGYVLGGEKYIYYGDDDYCKFSKGDLFFLGIGCHYTKEVAGDGQFFEMLTVHYSPEELQRMLLQLNLSYRITVANPHPCEKCHTQNHASMPAWDTVRLFFGHLGDCLQQHILHNDPVIENLKMTELLYLLTTREDCCLLSKILRNIDSSRDVFQQIVHANIFTDLTIDELATLCNRSLTSFKKDFHRIYDCTPHSWFTTRRMIHARLLLISTDKSISEIGAECGYPNTSHFIKLFRKQYGMTPAQYRSNHRKT